MKKSTVCIVLFALLLLSSCADLFSPPYDSRLEGMWKGSVTSVTKNEYTDMLGNNYTVVTTEDTTEKCTFYNGNEVKKERTWSKEVQSNGVTTSSSGGNGTSIWEWKNLRDNLDVDITNIDSGKISIDGFELIKQ